nr:hypothetical protein [Prevotella corporis]
MVAAPDVIEECESDFCRKCGRDLSDVEKELDYVSQIVDLPTMAPVVTEYRHYKRFALAGAATKTIHRANVAIRLYSAVTLEPS